jgi:hypothetical protein
MKPEHYASIVLVAVAVIVVALFLVAIVWELRRTHLRLVTILGAVGDTVNKTDGLDAVVAGISADLAAGQAVLADTVSRLEQRLGAEPEVEEEVFVMKKPVNTFDRPGDVFSKY